MKCFHTLWTRPYAMVHADLPYDMADFDIFCMALSALEWREKNGSISLVTDKVGADYIYSSGLAFLRDDGISQILDNIPYTVDPTSFWAAGKLYALNSVSAPCVMLDTDFIVWEALSEIFDTSELAVIHREPLSPDIYPNPSAFICSENYSYPADWDFSAEACNTAFCYINSQELKQRYCKDAIEFINAARGRHPVHYMVFAEQRILPMCAGALDIPIKSLSDFGRLFSVGQNSFTHLWGYKGRLRRFENERTVFCRRCARRIQTDFPEIIPSLTAKSKLAEYF